MRSLCKFFAGFVLMTTFVIAEEVRQPGPKIELGDITLRDGRVLKGARLLGSGTWRKLNIAHKGGIEQVWVDQFTPEFVEAHKAIFIEATAEYRSESEIRSKILAEQRREKSRREAERQAAMRQSAELDRQAMERTRKELAEAERQQKLREEAEARRAAFKAAELARSRDGVILDLFNRFSDGTYLVVHNAHDNPRRFDWRELRARKTDGRLVIPINCESPNERDRSLDIRSGEKRTFVVRWMGGNDDVEAITWADGGQEISWKQPSQKVEEGPIPTAPGKATITFTH